MRNLKAIISDVDGVLTDGKLFYGPKGEEFKVFNVHDGLAIKSLIKKGIKIGLISSKDSEALRYRAKELGIINILFGVNNKFEGCKKLISEMKINSNHSIYIGDDLNDIEPSRLFGKSYAVANASTDLKSNVSKTLKTNGGEGIFKEIHDELKMKGIFDK